MSRIQTKLPLEKRVLFVHVDELVITPAAVAAYEADLDETVSAGKRRRVEHDSAVGVEISSTFPIEEPSTSAGSSSVSGMSEGDSVETFESLWSSRWPRPCRAKVPALPAHSAPLAEGRRVQGLQAMSARR